MDARKPTSGFTALDPASDWRAIAAAVRDYPRCKNCGEPYGNAYFGAAHAQGMFTCPGYEPEQKP